MNDDVIILACIAGCVGMLAFFVAQRAIARGEDGKLRSRLTGKGPRRVVSTAPKIKQFVQEVGQVAAAPFMPNDAQKQQVVRRTLARAGIYTPSAIRLVTGAKVICLGAGLVMGWLIGSYINQLMFGLSLGGLAGYLAPVLWIRVRTSMNQRELTEGLADALDLMVVCVEAGLTIDAAMQRVGQELILVHPALSREMGMTHMETRVGLARADALRNMGERTGNMGLRSLASMLVQADRFGTSIADALRVHSETLRLARQMAAEESAGKASVKMSFPLVLCIFPSTFIVLAGPTIIQLLRSPLFN